MASSSLEGAIQGVEGRHRTVTKLVVILVQFTQPFDERAHACGLGWLVATDIEVVHNACQINE
jgi:hypothetical protein